MAASSSRMFGADSANTLKVGRTADLLVAYGRNDSIARLKLRLLGEAAIG